MGTYWQPYDILKEGYQAEGAGLCAVVHGGKMRDRGWELKREVQAGREKELFFCEDSQALE